MGTSEVHAGGGGNPAIDLHTVPMGKRQYPCHFNLGILGKRPCEAGMQKHCQEYNAVKLFKKLQALCLLTTRVENFVQN